MRWFQIPGELVRLCFIQDAWRAMLYAKPLQKHRSSLEDMWFVSHSFQMGALATLGKSCLLTKAYLRYKKLILEGKVKPAGGSKDQWCGRAGVKGKRIAVCDFLHAFTCRQNPCTFFLHNVTSLQPILSSPDSQLVSCLHTHLKWCSENHYPGLAHWLQSPPDIPPVTDCFPNASLTL